MLLQGKRKMDAELRQWFQTVSAREAWQPSSCRLTVLMQYSNWSAVILHPHWIYGDTAHGCHRAAWAKEKWPEELSHPPSTVGGSRRRHRTGCLLIKIYAVCLYISINHFWVHVNDHESQTYCLPQGWREYVPWFYLPGFDIRLRGTNSLFLTAITLASGEILISRQSWKKWSSRVPEARLWIHQPCIQLHV